MGITEEYFLSADDDMVQYLTSQGVAAIEEKQNAFYVLRDRAQKMLFMLIAGIGGSVLLMFNGVRAGLAWFPMVGLLLFAVGWFCCVIYLGHNCLKTKKRPIVGTSPLYLYTQEANGQMVRLDKLLRLRLYDYSNAYEQLDVLNADMCRHFDRTIYAVSVVPVISVLIALPFLFF